MAFSGLRSNVFCRVGRSSSLNSEWDTWRRKEPLLSKMCCCGFVLLIRTDFMYRSNRALWKQGDTRLCNPCNQRIKAQMVNDVRTVIIHNNTLNRNTHLMLLYCSFVFLSSAEVQTHPQHGHSSGALLQTQQCADVLIHQSRVLLKTTT